MAEQKSSSALAAPLHGAASVLRKVPGAGVVGRAAQGTLDKVGAVSPKGRRLAVYTGAGVLGVAGVVEWPVALTGAAVAWLTQPRPEHPEQSRGPGRLTGGGQPSTAPDTGTAHPGAAEDGGPQTATTDAAPGGGPSTTGTTQDTGATRRTGPAGAAETAGPAQETGTAEHAARRTAPAHAPATGEPAQDIATAALTSAHGGAEAPKPPAGDRTEPPTGRTRPTGKPPTGKASTGTPTGKEPTSAPGTGHTSTGPLGPTARPGRTTL
ncbi:hypothetical protein [Streptomyces sp. NPDC018610]|uniref:hypothetical protein n=1 Tax=Streptomyces sp. NPDC018610 TaxID=3365049 RepID=UPI0037A80307